MGNKSCIPTITSGNSATKVLNSDGRLRVYPRPVKVAELMLENPGQFVCPASNLQVGHRVSGLSADAELEPQMLYFLLPLELLYSVLTTDEVTSLNTKANKAVKLGSLHNLGKIFGVFMFPSETKRLESDSTVQMTEQDTFIRITSQKSWRPALDTIVEAS